MPQGPAPFVSAQWYWRAADGGDRGRPSVEASSRQAANNSRLSRTVGIFSHMTATQRVPSIRTALVVDDEPHVVELITDVLTSEGFSVTTAADGPAALRRARASQPD